MQTRGSLALVAAFMVGAMWMPPVTSSTPRDSVRVQAVVPCSLPILGEAAALDTTGLERLVRPSGPLPSTEGSQTIFYLEKGMPRAIRVVYYGETGRASVTFFLASATDFVAEREELEYEEPTSIQSQPHITSRLRSTLFVCDGKPVDPFGPSGQNSITTELDSALAWLGAHPK